MDLHDYSDVLDLCCGYKGERVDSDHPSVEHNLIWILKRKD